MPTGYTYGIIDGTITSFPQFAKQCIRAFGAAIHMRDDDGKEEYRERVPSDHHKKELKRAKNDLKNAQKLPDDLLVKAKIKELEVTRIRKRKYLEESIINEQRLTKMLNEVRSWTPPTTEHEGIKKFMIEQLESTIDFDCNSRDYNNDIVKIDSEISNANAIEIRAELIKKAQWDVDYHTKELAEEIKRCENSNKWVSDLINSLN